MLKFSKIIQHIMIDKDLSQKELASNSGMAASNISRMLKNEKNDYSINHLNRILSACNCSISVVITDNESGNVLYTVTEEKES